MPATLTPEQSAVVGCTDPLVMVDAVAGAGKSHCLAEKAFEEASRGVGVLLVMFGRTDAESMRQKLAARFHPVPVPKHVHVFTFDSIVERLLASHKIAWSAYTTWGAARELAKLVFQEPDFSKRHGSVEEEKGFSKLMALIVLPVLESMLSQRFGLTVLPPPSSEPDEWLLPDRVANQMMNVVHRAMHILGSHNSSGVQPVRAADMERNEWYAFVVRTAREANGGTLNITDLKRCAWWRDAANVEVGLALLRFAHGFINLSETPVCGGVMPEYARCLVATDFATRPELVAATAHSTHLMLVDETQDLNPNMVLWVTAMSQKTRVVMVGDPYQHIYGFMGSSNIMDPEVCQAIFGADRPVTRLSLTHSMRLPPQVAQAVNRRFVRTIVGTASAEGAGVVADVTLEGSVIPHARRAHGSGAVVVLSRTNKALAENVVRFSKAMRVRTSPFDASVPPSLKWSVMGASASALRPFSKWLETHRTKHGPGQKPPARAPPAATNDNMSWEKHIIASHTGTAMQLADVHGDPVARAFVSDWRAATVVFSTVHRFKGKEADTVFCDESLMGEWDTQAHVNHTYTNLVYTAMTRPTRMLMLARANET